MHLNHDVIKGERTIIKKHTAGYFLAVFVALMALFVYLPSLQNGFVTWDDNNYIYRNPDIQSLNYTFLKWAFLDFHISNWHPFTWISHAIDYAVWGLFPLGHHLTNIVLHAINSFLVVLLIIRLLDCARDTKTITAETEGLLSDKGMLIAAGMTGLLFGIHPIHVESVAWVSERKDLLYAFFYLLSLLAYIRYLEEERKAFRHMTILSPFSSRSYMIAVVFFVLSLLSKPMAVTLPVVLLVLDWYPFERLARHKWTFVLSEKIPFFLLSLASSIITVQAQRLGESIKSFTAVPLTSRILVGLKALMDYLTHMIVPVDLSPFYPYPDTVALSHQYLLPALFFMGVTLACILSSRKHKVWSAAVDLLFCESAACAGDYSGRKSGYGRPLLPICRVSALSLSSVSASHGFRKSGCHSSVRESENNSHFLCGNSHCNSGGRTLP